MFDNPKKNLSRLERELLAEEAENRHEMGNSPVPKAKNTDSTDVDPREFANEVRGGNEGRAIARLALLACLLMLGILGVAAWWLLYLL